MNETSFPWKPSRRMFLAGATALLATSRIKAAPRNLMGSKVTVETLKSVLLPVEQWKPWPTAADRAAWEGLPADARKELIDNGVTALKTPWAVLPATIFLEYKRNGNRSHYETIRDTRRARLMALTLAECAEGKGRFLDEVLNGLWLTCEETYWGLPAHLTAQKAGPGLPDVNEPIVDLFAAETSAEVAWTLYLLRPGLEKINPLLAPRLYYEMEHRLLKPNLERDDFGWMGIARPGRPAPSLNNWTPWICSNWLTTALLAERDATRRVQAVYKIIGCVDRWMNGYTDDGGCDEGPGYWNAAGGALYDNLELLRSASGAKLDFFGEPLVKEIGRYIYRAHIAGDYFTNFSDAPAKVTLSANMVYGFGQRIGDPKMMALGAWSERVQANGKPSGGNLGRQVAALFNLEHLRAQKAEAPYVKDVWLPGIGVMAARLREGSTDGLYLAAECGHNGKSHNHNDVGNFVAFANGKPAIIDVGVETYTAKTFSAQRYEIWTMQSGFHNCPTIGGVMQHAGRQYAASDVSYQADDARVQLGMNIEHAYPAEAGLKKWRRTVRLDRAKDEIEIRDQWALNKTTGEITLTLMTAVKAVESSAGELTLPGVGARVNFDAKTFVASVEEIKTDDARLSKSWGDRVYRVLLTCKQPGMSGDWSVRVRMG